MRGIAGVSGVTRRPVVGKESIRAGWLVSEARKKGTTYLVGRLVTRGSRLGLAYSIAEVAELGGP